MAKHIVETMLPEHDAKIHKLSLHERKWLQLEMCIYDIFCIFCMSNLSFSAMDGDQLVDFYWIDPMLTAERIAAKTQYAGHMYYQFELEESWDRAGVRAFGRINGGLVFEAAHIRPNKCPTPQCFLC